MNTCNGATIFEKNNSEIKSEENKLIVFDGKLRHKAKSQTDTDRRIVINFNWRNKLVAKSADGTDVKTPPKTQPDSLFRDGSGLLKLGTWTYDKAKGMIPKEEYDFTNENKN